METKGKRLVPARAVHPGEVLREELKERGFKQKDFAKMIGVQPTHLSEFINGKRNLNESLALKLEQALGISYKNWMNLHNGYVYDLKAIGQRDFGQAVKFKESVGELIEDELSLRKMDESQLSELTGIKQPVLSDMMNGKLPLTAEAALLVENALGISAAFLLNVQMQQQLESARTSERVVSQMRMLQGSNVQKHNATALA